LPSEDNLGNPNQKNSFYQQVLKMSMAKIFEAIKKRNQQQKAS